MTTHPFPEIEPEVTVVPRPEAELREVLRTDAGGFFVPLEVGAETKWSFYDWPDRKLTNVSLTRVVGPMRYRGEDCLEVVDTIISGADEEWWSRWFYLVKDETMTWLAREGHWSRPPRFTEADVTPWPLRLRPGLRWEGHEIYRCGAEEEGVGDRSCGAVEGPFGVTVPAATHLCLRESWWTYRADGTPNTMAEVYVAESGRSIYFRRFNGPAWRNYEELGKAGVPEREFEGVVWRLWYECLPEIALG